MATHCQSVCMCVRCSSLDRNATWQVLHVKGWVDCTDAIVVEWTRVRNYGVCVCVQKRCWVVFGDGRVKVGVGKNVLEGRAGEVIPG